MSQQSATSVFTVAEMVPQPFEPSVTTGLPNGYALMRKEFSGDIGGSSQTQFTYAFDPERGGTYLAIEAFEGSINGRSGACNIVHSATTTGTDRIGEMVLIVPGSGTADLTGITGTGSITIDADGTHHLALDYELEA